MFKPPPHVFHRRSISERRRPVAAGPAPMLLVISIACLGLIHTPLRGHSVRPRLTRTPPACDIGSADDRREFRATTQHSDDLTLLAGTQQLPPRSIEMALTRLVLPCASYAALIWTTTCTAHLLKDHLDWVYAWNCVTLVLLSIGGQTFASAQTYWFDILDWQKAIKPLLGEVDFIASARLTTLATEAAEALGVPPPKNVHEVCTSEPFACAFATAESTVCVSTGLQELLTEKELLAVLAHELGHLRHKDTLYASVMLTAVCGLKAPFAQGSQLALSQLNPENRWAKGTLNITLLPFVTGLYLMSAGVCPYLLSFLVEFADKAVRRGFELDADLAAAEAFGADATICGLSKTEYSTDATGSPMSGRVDKLVRQVAERVYEKKKVALEHDYYGAKRSLTDGELKKAGLDNPIVFAAREVAKIEAVMRTTPQLNTLCDYITVFWNLQSTHPTLEVRIAAIEKAVNDGRVLRTIFTAAPDDDDESTRADDEPGNARPEFVEFAELFASGPPAAPAGPNAATNSMAATIAKRIPARNYYRRRGTTIAKRIPARNDYRRGATIAKRVPATTLTPSVFLFAAYAMAAVLLA